MHQWLLGALGSVVYVPLKGRSLKDRTWLIRTRDKPAGSGCRTPFFLLGTPTSSPSAVAKRKKRKYGIIYFPVKTYMAYRNELLDKYYQTFILSKNQILLFQQSRHMVHHQADLLPVEKSHITFTRNCIGNLFYRLYLPMPHCFSWLPMLGCSYTDLFTTPHCDVLVPISASPQASPPCLERASHPLPPFLCFWPSKALLQLQPASQPFSPLGGCSLS